MRTPLIVASGVLVASCIVCSVAGFLVTYARRAPPPPAWVGTANLRARFACAEPRARADAAIVGQRAEALAAHRGSTWCSRPMVAGASLS
ncbi:MAG: hypothetical protein OHK0013_11270 [Sandaracinaceae bacterium]